MAVRLSRTFIGLALVGLGVVMAVWSYNGYGKAMGCGTWGLRCFIHALAWHFCVQGMATAVLWWAVWSEQRGTKWARRALAVGATLLLLLPVLIFLW